jgi:hypothetical protein
LEVLVAGGEPFTASQLKDINRAIDIAEKMSGLAFTVYVGPVEGGRAGAESILATQLASRGSVLVAVDPDARSVDVVTAGEALRWLPDDRCRLAILTMSSRFTQGDIAGGIRAGLIVLGEQAMHPATLFTDEPV